MITTYIFDLDGTLVPYAPREQQALARLAEGGADLERFRAINGDQWPDVEAGRLTIEAKWYRQALAAGASEEAANRFVADMTAFDPAYPDVLPLLQELAPHKKLGVITNGPPGDHQRAKLRAAGLDRFFGDRVVISAEVGAAKPNPAIFHHALVALGATAESALFVGDSLNADAAGAVGAGLTGVWLDRENKGGALPEGVLRICSLADLPR